MKVWLHLSLLQLLKFVQLQMTQSHSIFRFRSWISKDVSESLSLSDWSFSFFCLSHVYNSILSFFLRLSFLFFSFRFFYNVFFYSFSISFRQLPLSIWNDYLSSAYSRKEVLIVFSVSVILLNHCSRVFHAEKVPWFASARVQRIERSKKSLGDGGWREGGGIQLNHNVNFHVIVKYC